VLLAARAPYVFLLHISERQTLEDLAAIDQMKLVGAEVVVAPLHCTRWHGGDIQALAQSAQRGLTRVAAEVLANRPQFSSLTPDDISFHGPAHALALKYQEEIARLFRPYEITKTDLALCSVAAQHMVRRIVSGRCRVVAVPDSLGGTTTFAATVATADLAGELHRLIKSGFRFRRVFLPSSFWCYRDRDLYGVGPEALRTEFPNVDFVVLPVPVEALQCRLTCSECAAYSCSRNELARSRPSAAGAGQACRIFVCPQPLGWVGRTRAALCTIFPGRGDVVVCAAARQQAVREIVGADVRVIPIEAITAADSGPSRGVEPERVQETGLNRDMLPPLRRLIVLTAEAFEQDALPSESVARIEEMFSTTKILVVVIPAF